MRLRLRLSLFICLAIIARADQITLKNGDRITGIIGTVDGSSLIIKTDYAGDLTVKWDQVASVTSDTPVYVTTRDGQRLLGTLTTEADGFAVKTRDSGSVAVSRAQVAAIRSQDAENAIGAWSGFADAALSLSRGNSETTNFVLGASATRATEKDKFNIYASSLWARNQVAGLAQTTASAIHGGLRYDYNLSKRTSIFGFTDFDHDRFQQLDLRNVIGGGLDYQLVKSERTQFDVFAGADLNQEFFSTFTRRSAEALIGQQLDHKLSGAFSVHERFAFTPNLSDIGEYRMVFDLGTVTKVSKAFSWQMTLTDRYLSNPPFGLKANDLLLTTGVRLTFGPSGSQ